MARVPPSSGGGTPYLAFRNQEPDLSHIRVFGCPAFAHVDADLRRKFEDRAIPGIFVGYDINSPCYLI